MYQDRREQRGNQKKCKAGRADQHKSKKGGQHGVDYGQGQTANPTDETNALVTGSPSALFNLWVRASEVIWPEYTRIISVLSDAK